jgi:hypothetical protein
MLEDSTFLGLAQPFLKTLGLYCSSHMNRLLIGTADKTEQLLDTPSGFLLIDDGPVADAFLAKFPQAKLFDPAVHHFNPLKAIDYKRARDFAATVYSASPEGGETLTVRNGRRALAKLLLSGARRLDKLPQYPDPGSLEALATIEDLLLSPVLKAVLCNPTNFSFKGSVVAKIDRATLGDFDAFVLGSLLIGQAKGQVIVPDFGFYGRMFHMALIRQERLIAGVNFLDELPPKLRQGALQVEEKTGQRCTFEDAQTLAQYARLTPNTTAHTELVQRLME